MGTVRPKPARPFHPGHAPTSQAAYKELVERLTDTIWGLYNWIEQSGKRGMNTAELCEASGSVHQTVSARLADMKRLGMVAHRRAADGTYYTRKGDRDREQFVYVAIPVGEWIPTDANSRRGIQAAKLKMAQDALKKVDQHLADLLPYGKGRVVWLIQQARADIKKGLEG